MSYQNFLSFQHDLEEIIKSIKSLKSEIEQKFVRIAEQMNLRHRSNYEKIRRNEVKIDCIHKYLLDTDDYFQKWVQEQKAKKY
mgnify:CR=1 FL=1